MFRLLDDSGAGNPYQVVLAGVPRQALALQLVRQVAWPLAEMQLGRQEEEDEREDLARLEDKELR